MTIIPKRADNPAQKGLMVCVWVRYPMMTKTNSSSAGFSWFIKKLNKNFEIGIMQNVINNIRRVHKFFKKWPSQKTVAIIS